MQPSLSKQGISGWNAQCWAGVLLGLLVLIATWVAPDDRTTALAAGLLFLVTAGSGLLVLRLDPLSPPMAYLYVFGVFHLGFIVPSALEVSSRPVPAWVTTQEVAPALHLVALALCSYQLGAVVAALRWRRRAPAAPVRYQNVILYHCGIGVVLAGFLVFAFGVQSFGTQAFADADYVGTYRLAAWRDPRLFTTSLTIVPIGFYLAAAAVPWRKLAFVLALLAAWAGSIFFLGFRGHALVPLVTIAVILSKRGLRAPKWLWVVGLAALLSAIPAARTLRDSPLTQRSLSDAVRVAHPLAALEEMGGSLEPLVHTVRLMETESYRMGGTYWRAARRILPNLSLDWQGRTYLPLEDLPATHWVTRQAAPWKHEHFGGIGFSAVAEPYMNFGAAGVAGYFVLLGVGLVWADRADKVLPTRLALLAAVFGPLLWTTRGSFDSFFRPAAWGVACVLVARVFADSLRSTRAARVSNTQPRARQLALNSPRHSER